MRQAGFVILCQNPAKMPNKICHISCQQYYTLCPTKRVTHVVKRINVARIISHILDQNLHYVVHQPCNRDLHHESATTIDVWGVQKI